MSQASVPWRPRSQPEYNLLARMIVGPSRAIHRMCAPLLRRFAAPIFFGACIAVVLLVWGHALVFNFVDHTIIGGPTDDPERTGWWGAPLSLPEVAAGLRESNVPLSGLLAYTVYPLQYALFRDVLILGGLFGLISLIPMFGIWWERKVASHLQSRCGPMRVGGWHGWAQLLADGVKLFCKEDLVPAGADKPLFLIAPYLAFIPAAAAFVALPFGSYWVFRNLDVGLVFILAMLGIEVVGVIIAGWASNNKWSVYGAMREACQMVSYEIPMGMALLLPVMTVGSLSLVTVGEAQRDGWHTWLVFHNPFLFLGAVGYFIASLASCKRAPFDLPEGESELVAGFLTEYSGWRWCLFFFGEYAAMFVVSGLATILFLGAWYSPLPTDWALSGDGLMVQAVNGLLFSGPLWFVGKAMFLIFVQMWLRWTLPRIRIDQVLYSCVQVLLPLVMLTLLGNTFWELFVPPGSVLAVIANVILSIIGAVLAAGFIAIAGYGWWHRQRLVGRLAVDLLPGS